MYISIVDANRDSVKSNSQTEHGTGPRSLAIWKLMQNNPWSVST